jgi:hypothetical protein
MARRVFYSFDYERDWFRVQQVKQMGVLAGQPLLSSNRWEEVTGGSDRGIKRWIDEQMEKKSCVVVLIGRRTAEREWVQYEIRKAWEDGRGLVGVFFHNLQDQDKRQTTKGTNPFRHFKVGGARKIGMNLVVPANDPPFVRSTSIYRHIATNLPTWVEDAIQIRNEYA